DHEAGWAPQTRIHLMVNTGVAGTLRSIEPWPSTWSPATRAARVSTTGLPADQGKIRACGATTNVVFMPRTSQSPRVTTSGRTTIVPAVASTAFSGPRQANHLIWLAATTVRATIRLAV